MNEKREIIHQNLLLYTNYNTRIKQENSDINMWFSLPTTTWWNARHTLSTFNYSSVQLCNYQFHLLLENYCINWLDTLQRHCQRQRNPWRYLSLLPIATWVNSTCWLTSTWVYWGLLQVYMFSHQAGSSYRADFKKSRKLWATLPIPISAPNFHHTWAKLQSKMLTAVRQWR